MPIDVDAATTAAPTVRRVSWTERDVILYHLGLGAGAGTSGTGLRWAYEKDLRVLPTFAVVAGQGVSAGAYRSAGLHLPGIDIDLSKTLHGGEALRMHAPIPSSGTAEVSIRVSDVWDKGKAAVIVLEESAVDGDTPLWTSRRQVWVRGEGGFGGDPGPRSTQAVPDRAPDAVLTSETSPDLAAIYRLSGDANPVHVDPDFAALAGFDAPILHGLATYGIVCKHIVDDLLDGDPGRVIGYEVRFAGILFPGETIRTSVWYAEGDYILHADCPERGDKPVLTHARMTVR